MREMQLSMFSHVNSHTNLKHDAQNVDITDRAQILPSYLGPEMGNFPFFYIMPGLDCSIETSMSVANFSNMFNPIE